MAVWDKFIQALDGNKNIFLQEDIKRLSAFKNQIDDEVNTGSSAFFDTTFAIYSQRVKEAEEMCMKILSAPMDLSRKESVMVDRKNQPAPADKAAREDLWRKLLKAYTLRRYMDMEAAEPVTAHARKGVDARLEQAARGKVKKWCGQFFRQANAKDAISQKFALYMAVAVMEIDPHTAYTAPEDRSFNEMITKRYYGLGIELGEKDADFFVKRLLPGGTAYRSGKIKENDNILAIVDTKGELQDVSGWEQYQVATLLRGEKGTSVTLKLQQPGAQPRTETIERGEIIDSESKIKSALIEKDGKKFGYIYLPDFYLDASGFGLQGAGADMINEVAKLQENEVAGIIIDLRGNGGGSLDEAVKMDACFMPAGPVTWLRGKDSSRVYNSVTLNNPYNGPLVLMVDENSASASEIFAASLQDRGRAMIVGTTSTFGKGTAQMTYALGKMGDASKGIPDTAYGSMRLTQNKFYRVNGTSTQFKGVLSDIVLQDRMSLESIREKDFSSALPYDTLAVPSFPKLPLTYDYQAVVQHAKNRIGNNASFVQVAANMKKIKSLNEEPTPLNIDAYRNKYREISACEKAVRDGRELKGNRVLNAEQAFFLSISPASQKAAFTDNERRKEWLQKLGKDVYLDETVSVLEDMISNAR